MPAAPAHDPVVAYDLDDAAVEAITAGVLSSDDVQPVAEPAERVDGGWWVPVRVFLADD